MTTTIHPTAIVETGAKLGENVSIGPYCIVGAHVNIGAGTVLYSHVVLAGHTTLGAENHVFPFVSLGQPPQDLKYHGEASRLVIGSRNQIREYVTMHPGTAEDREETTVGDDNLFMASSHVAHDCVVGNGCIFANGATLAGHVTVEDGGRIGGLSAVAQFVRIGREAFVGGHVGVERDIPPFSKFTRREEIVPNTVGLRRKGLEKDEIVALAAMFEQLYGEDRTMPLTDLAQQLLTESQYSSQKTVLEFILSGQRKREANGS
ncbi:MAG: acyl-ACP--UDP-N-acetylglucosamine O-acyltransferase [Alphaproteobacteria bacterium]